MSTCRPRGRCHGTSHAHCPRVSHTRRCSRCCARPHVVQSDARDLLSHRWARNHRWRATLHRPCQSNAQRVLRWSQDDKNTTPCAKAGKHRREQTTPVAHHRRKRMLSPLPKGPAHPSTPFMIRRCARRRAHLLWPAVRRWGGLHPAISKWRLGCRTSPWIRRWGRATPWRVMKRQKRRRATEWRAPSVWTTAKRQSEETISWKRRRRRRTTESRTASVWTATTAINQHRFVLATGLNQTCLCCATHKTVTFRHFRRMCCHRSGATGPSVPPAMSTRPSTTWRCRC